MSDSVRDVPQLARALQAMQALRARLEAAEQARSEPIAVVGMACRFPGGADSPAAFWRLLADGGDGITEVPADRWDAAALYDPDVDRRGRIATRWGGFIDGVDLFDPGFFGIAPREAAEMDPQQRLVLEVGWEALEHAGLALDELRGSATGVFMGVHSHSADYAALQMARLEDVGTYTSTGTAHSIVANRLSYWLDLRGPSLAVDTACSSSLVAVHLAVQSLRAQECGLAVAGGVNLMLTPEVSVALSRMRMMAVDGRCKTFDAAADGFVRGEGCGVVVLKRLSDAVRDGDRVLAVVAGSAVNQDGATNGLTAPSGLAQADVVRRALADGRVDGAAVTYVETHGTGTPLGDPIEVEALAAALGDGVAPCRLGAVKTNIGHLEGAAGIAGLIKVVLSLRHQRIPANLHYRALNPHLRLDGTRFIVAAEPHAWPAGTARHAGVSSFGFGGTNAHVVLREAPPAAAAPETESGAPAATETGGCHVLTVSAHSAEALAVAARNASAFLATSPEPIGDICHTAAVRRTHHEHRLAAVGGSAAELTAGLDGWLAGLSDTVVVGRADADAPRRLVFVFSGQGSQWRGMARALIRQEPVFRTAVEECAALFRSVAEWSPLDELAADGQGSRLHDTAVTQPVVFAIQIGLAALWRSWGVTPAAVIGHSAGEVAAACVAGALDLEQAIRLIHLRGRVMQRAAGQGRMAAVGLAHELAAVFAEAAGVSVAAVNGPNATVLSGAPAAIEAAVAELTERGIFVRLLPVHLAAHSAQMEPLATELVDALAWLTPRAATVPLYSTVTGRAVRGEDLDAAYWGRNLRQPVLFSMAVQAACNPDVRAGVDFLEISPHPMLRTPLEQCTGGDAAVLGSLDEKLPDREALLRSAAALHVRGHDVQWSAVYPAGCLVDLPAYPWQRQRCWIDIPRRSSAGPDEAAASWPPVLRRLSSPALRAAVFETTLAAGPLAVFGEHRIGGVTVLPAAAYVALALATNARTAGAAVDVADLALHAPLELPDGDRRRVQVVINAAGEGTRFEVHARDDDEGAEWRLHASGRLEPASFEVPSREARGEAAPGEVVTVNGGDPAALVLDAALRLAAAGVADGIVVAGIGRVRLSSTLPALQSVTVHCRVHAGAEGGASVAIEDAAGAPLGEVADIRFARVGGLAPDPTSWEYEVVWRPRGLLAHAGQGASAGTGPLDLPGAPAEDHAGAALRTALDDLSAGYAAEALSALGAGLVPGRLIDEAALAAPLARHHARLLGRLFGILAQDGILERRDGLWQVVSAPAPRELAGSLEELQARFPEHASELALFGRCAPRLADVLLGRCDPLDLLFGMDAAAETAGLYRDAAVSRAANQRMRATLEALVARLPEDGVLRVLEVGAGTGGTTAHILPVLPEDRTEYVFTDVSRAFVERAARQFVDRPSLRCKTLDLEADPAAQGFAPGQFDVVVAANVLHATSDVRASVHRLGSLLVPGGALMLLEGVEPTRWIDVVFGLTDGWWRFDDDVRTTHPLLSAERWTELLGECGFTDVAAVPAGSALFPQAVLAARSGGARAEYAQAEPTAALAGQWLIVEEGAGPGAMLAERIEARLGACRMVRPPLTAEVDRDADARALEAQVGEWLADAAGAARLLYVAAADAAGGGPAGAEQLVDRVSRSCGGIGAVARALLAADGHPASRLWVVTRGAQPVRPGETADAAAAALWGFGRSVALDCADRWGGLIDLQAHGSNENDAAFVLGQITGSGAEDQAAFRDGLRYVPRLRAVRRAPPEPQSGAPVLITDGTWLVTGGLGALGLQIGEWLARRGARRVVLVSRTPMPPHAEWPALDESTPAGRAAAAIARMEAAGARVTTVAGDVADPSAMGALFGRFGTCLPPLRGVVHAAATMDFAPLARLDEAALRAVLRPKVAGAWLLHRLTASLDIDHFVLFSSVAGLWGSRGMAHYAAANQFLDALAHRRHACGLPALSVNWGGWAGGDADRDANRFIAHSAFRLMPAGLALDRLGAAMAEDVTQRAIAWVDWPEVQAGYQAGRPRPFLREVAGVAAPDAPHATGKGTTSLQQRLAAATAEDARDLLLEQVRGHVAEVLRLDPARLLEPGQGFFRLGMDSLTTVELRARLDRSLGVALPATIAFEYPTVEALAGYLNQLMRPAPARNVTRDASAAVSDVAHDHESEGLDGLAEADLAALLDSAIAGVLDDQTVTP